MGETINKWGLVECKVDERFLRLLITLAMKRCEALSGWMDLSDLNLISRTSETPRALGEYLRMRLDHYEPKDRDPESEPTGHLIEYKQAGAGTGISRGPYRLGALPGHVDINRTACLQFLLQKKDVTARDWSAHPDALLEEAARSKSTGTYIETLFVLEKAVQTMMFGEFAYKGSRRLDPRLPEVLLSLGVLEMNLRFSEAAWTTARVATSWFDAMQHPLGKSLGRSRSLLVQAHVLGQWEQWDEAIRFIRRARAALDNASRTSRQSRLLRTEILGSEGQFMSGQGLVDQARSRMIKAERQSVANQEAHSSTIWAARLAENAIRGGRQDEAEGHLRRASSYEAVLSGIERVVYSRIWARFTAAAQRTPA